MRDLHEEKLLGEARDWIKDIFVDSDEYIPEIDKLSPRAVRFMINRHWSGGWSDFVRCMGEL